MTDFEKSALVGYYRMGMSYRDMALIFVISETYARMIIREYLETKGEKIRTP